MKIYKIVLFLVLASPIALAQISKNTDQQTLAWIRYSTVLPITEKWSLQSELDNRIFINPVLQNAFVFRSQGRYRANKNLDLGAGVAYFNTNTQNPNVNPDFSIPEYRVQQDVTVINAISKMDLQHRFLLEERFIQKASKIELLEDYSFSMRLRYRLQATFVLWEKEKTNWKGILSEEVMFNFGRQHKRNTFDQSRFYGAARYAFNPNVSLELGYLKSFQRRASGVDFYDRDIIRFSVFHTIRRKSKA